MPPRCRVSGDTCSDQIPRLVLRLPFILLQHLSHLSGFSDVISINIAFTSNFQLSWLRTRSLDKYRSIFDMKKCNSRSSRVVVIYILNHAFLESRVRDLIYCRDQCKIILRHYWGSVIIHHERWLMRQERIRPPSDRRGGAQAHIIR